MKDRCVFRSWCVVLFAVCSCLLSPASRAATVFFHLELFRDNNPDGTFFYAFPYFDTTPAPITSHSIYSPNGTLRYRFDAGQPLELSGGSFSDLNTVLNEITNGLWTLVLNTNHASQAIYKFRVSVTNLNNTTYPPVSIFYPAHNGTLTNPPPLHWFGPTNYTEMTALSYNSNFTYYYSEVLSPLATNWPTIPSLPAGAMRFEAHYATTNTSTLFQISTPTNASGTLSGWSAQPKLNTYRVHDYTVEPIPDSGHTLIAHYPFDENVGGEASGEDTSGNDNHINGSTGSGTPVHQFSTDDRVGGGASRFFGVTALAPPDPVVQALHGSFTVSLWVKTSMDDGQDPEDPGNFGAGIVHAGIGGNDTIPLSLTGGKAAFYTGNPGGYSDTVHSTNDVNTGEYVHIVVTRSQETGVKKIYVNGVLESSGVGTTAPLDGPKEQFDMLLGGAGGGGLDGLLDDVQIYTGALSAGEVAFLYNNPGETVPDGNPTASITGHYPFDMDDVWKDVSGNGLDMDTGGSWNGGGSAQDSLAIAGDGSFAYSRNPLDSDSGAYNGWNPTPPALLSTLAGSFSVSIWVKTLDESGFQNDYAFDGAGIVSADVPGTANDVIPIALTGGQVAFNTGGDFDETLNSSTLVNDDEWHHIVVTRDQPTGLKRIYVDGVLDLSGSGTTNLLNDPRLLTIGALADGSQTNADDGAYYNGYEGLIDDLQIYPRALNGAEVAFLYDNPGLEVTNSIPDSIGPVSADITLDFYRIRGYGADQFYVFPKLNTVTPSPTTEHRVRSPNGMFEGTTTGSSATVQFSLQSVLQECTTGNWTLKINENDATEKVYTFTVSIAGLTTNLLSPVTILTPTNGAVNVPTNSPMRWAGPASYSSIFVFVSPNIQFLTLPASATNWPSPQALAVGTNVFQVNYTSNGFPTVSFSTPLDGGSQPIDGWTTHVNLHTHGVSTFVGSAGSPPVQVLDSQLNSGNLQFSFVSQSGRTHAIEARTNLVAGAWVELTNFIGDGTLKQFTFPATNPPVRFFRIKTQ